MVRTSRNFKRLLDSGYNPGGKAGEHGMTEEALDLLVEAARRAMANAYAPYSGFSVGAAVMADSGAVYEGCNVENASYPVSMCAERGAIAAAVSAGERAFTAIAIVASGGAPCPPCGMCRQALYEFGPDLDVILDSPEGSRMVYRLADLLPHAFGPASLTSRNGAA
jgi:cytidine deaminase